MKRALLELNLEEQNSITIADNVLVGRAKEGEKAAFEQLYRRNVDRVYAVCLRIVADVELAEELTQRTFIRSWEMLGSFRGESAFSSWLHRIAVNIVLADRRAHQRRVDSAGFDLAPEHDNADSSANPPGLTLDLEQAIALLPAGARAILVMHDIEGYQHEEIAILLDISIGTSKSQLHRAHKILKERLLS